MSSNPGAGERMLALYQSTANEAGEFGINTGATAAFFSIHTGTVGDIVRRLVANDCIVRIGVGRYRLTGKPFIPKKSSGGLHRNHVTSSPPLAMDDDTPTTPDTYRGGAPCTYATARACGIEPMVYLTPNRGVLNSTSGANRIAVTLARIPCLERPLPREAA